MNLSLVDRSLLLAAYFRGNTLDQASWTSCSDQVLALSLYYTGDISPEDCISRLSNRGYVSGLYDEAGELCQQISSRYQNLVDLLERQPLLLEGGGDFDTPAYPTFTACRLTNEGIQLIPKFIYLFPTKPEFQNWPDRRTYPIANMP